MRSALWIALLLSVLHAFAAAGRPQANETKPKQAPALPTVMLNVSGPNLDKPLPLPSTLMNGPPKCGPDGSAFIVFLTPPPLYNNMDVYSISADGKVLHYPLDTSGLTKPFITGFDAGVTGPVILLHAIPAGQPDGGFYLELFNYNGELESRSQLDLGFHPVSVSQLTEDSFLVVGLDAGEGHPRFVIIDDNGNTLRELGSANIMPSSSGIHQMFQSFHFAGLDPEHLPTAARLSMALSLFTPSHFDGGLLILEPGTNARVVEMHPPHPMRVVTLHLPKDQAARSIISGKQGWFVRASLPDNHDVTNLYRVDPQTGDATERIDTSKVPASSLACPTDSGFFGIRWLNRKAYLISADFK